jgi:isoquinoline 1-oxidoreductase alpha subunit
MELLINGRAHPLPDDTDPTMPLLWVLRDLLQFTGTKYGCGIGACGACTVRLDGAAVRSCITTLGAAQGRAVQTIEGLASAGTPHALQQAWITYQVPQCGYCQSGLLMTGAALLDQNPRPSDADIDAAITNLCRCGTLPRVRAAIHSAAASLQPVAPPKPLKPKAGRP